MFLANLLPGKFYYRLVWDMASYNSHSVEMILSVCTTETTNHPSSVSKVYSTVSKCYIFLVKTDILCFGMWNLWPYGNSSEMLRWIFEISKLTKLYTTIPCFNYTNTNYHFLPLPVDYVLSVTFISCHFIWGIICNSCLYHFTFFLFNLEGKHYYIKTSYLKIAC